MGDVLVLCVGVVAVPAVRLVLALVRGGRRQVPVVLDAYRPPPAGHSVELPAGERTLRCSCGWRHTVPWPRTGERVNRARLAHCAAVEQARLAERLGLDAGSVLDRILAARADAAAGVRADAGAGVHRVEAAAALPPVVAPARRSRRAAQALRASAVVRVEAAQVLPRYTGSDGQGPSSWPSGR